MTSLIRNIWKITDIRLFRKWCSPTPNLTSNFEANWNVVEIFLLSIQACCAPGTPEGRIFGSTWGRINTSQEKSNKSQIINWKFCKAFGFWLSAFGFWLLAFGVWLLAFGFSLSALGPRLSAFVYRLSALGFPVKREFFPLDQHFKNAAK